ncbi:hypothetical protein [Undibacterium sp.]|uniref:hypothetical protein n=1 Tax=Undibacterium sp. TaxID=1914977 RepID=UPI003752DDF8
MITREEFLLYSEEDGFQIATSFGEYADMLNCGFSCAQDSWAVYDESQKLSASRQAFSMFA